MAGRPKVYQFSSAIVRQPAGSVGDGLRAVDHGAPGYERVKAEHDAYCAALAAAGVSVQVLPPLEGFADALFVEDPALVFAEAAILLRPGAPSRQGEVAAIAPTLRHCFETVLTLPRGTVDGGDVLTTPDAVMIGLSSRTNREGAEALVDCLAGIGRVGKILQTPPGVLHFKSDCALLDESTVLSTARLAASGVFAAFTQIITPEGEEAGANALRVNDTVFVGDDYPGVIDSLGAAGYQVAALPTSEIAKIDAGLSCMSLRWHDGINM
ncbi:MAG: arginine deiminase family protein [Proteobacteria bacterium]|nr:arginine deiminase family protein [Pseudomonadota bacterium]MDA1309732.1 arginine deiminase family protein [Pseudomonadota bacterium]